MTVVERTRFDSTRHEANDRDAIILISYAAFTVASDRNLFGFYVVRHGTRRICIDDCLSIARPVKKTTT
jgi:hypothetical protein